MGNNAYEPKKIVSKNFTLEPVGNMICLLITGELQ